MHENISMKVLHDNQVRLPHSIVDNSSIAHFSDPSPQNFPQISRKIGISIYIEFNTKYPLHKYRPRSDNCQYSKVLYPKSIWDDKYIEVLINPNAAPYCASVVNFPEKAQQWRG